MQIKIKKKIQIKKTHSTTNGISDKTPHVDFKANSIN